MLLQNLPGSCRWIPRRTASQLLVTVGGIPGEPSDPAEVLERLNQVMGKLRSEVAAAITRKHATKLVFCVV